MELFYWCHTTSRQPFETGIQRVTRRLGSAFSRRGVTIIPVGRDDKSCLMEIIGRGPSAFEAALANSVCPPRLFIPELTADLVAQGADPLRMAKAYGLRTMTLVHDLIPLKLREHYPSAAVASYTAYYESLARSDAVLATTHGVADELRAFLEDRSLRMPPIAVVPLPAQLGDHARVVEAAPFRRDDEPLRLATVVSWERRKNLLRLLRAVERARCYAAVELTLVGRRGLDTTHNAEVEALLATTAGVAQAGPLPDHALVRLIATCHATVYPSWEEGFGLPIGESLWLGCPCLCHNGSAMAANTPGGGTFAIDMTDEDALTEALKYLATDPRLLTQLSEEARRRPLASWDDYACAVSGVLDV